MPIKEKIPHNRVLGEFLVFAGLLSFFGVFAYLGYRVQSGIYTYRPGEYQSVSFVMLASFLIFVLGAEMVLLEWKDRFPE